MNICGLTKDDSNKLASKVLKSLSSNCVQTCHGDDNHAISTTDELIELKRQYVARYGE
jgi:hypothetical protein